MLERTDRLALAGPEAAPAVETFEPIFDCEVVGDARDREAGARRVTLQWGRDPESFEPTGPGLDLTTLERWNARRPWPDR